MPRPADTPDSSQPLSSPSPELNPLLNPLLGDNMGRWAEVYFTNPPERRDRAVVELLRELESQPGSREVRSEDGGGNAHFPDDPRVQAATEHVCDSCGAANPGDQKYCGMCGVKLRAEKANPQPTKEMASKAEGIRERPNLVSASRGVNPELEQNPSAITHDWPKQSRTAQPLMQAPRIPERTGAELRSISERNVQERALHVLETDRKPPQSSENPNLIPDYEPESYRYRIYLGIVLAALLSVFIYMAWRSTQAGRSAAHALPAEVPSATSETTPQAAPSAREQSSPPPVAKTAAPAPAVKAARPAHDGTQTSRPSPVAATLPLAPLPAQAVVSRSDGSDELAIAQTYLNGTPGKVRDDGEAAKWLWKSVAKHNDNAALMLSDLYLRGSGVGKNCDQARLLLDAAARKGVSGAAERLRNLQAFGCQ